MNAATPIHNGSGVQKGGKVSTQAKTYHLRFPVDRAIDQFIASMEPDGGAISPGEVGTDVEIRVGCPFHKHDPKAHQSTSCKGKGLIELAKLKYVCVQHQNSSPPWILTHSREHLKQVHGLSLERLNADFNFRKREYNSLQTLEKKWELIYRRLFALGPEDPILCLGPTKRPIVASLMDFSPGL